MYQIEAEQSVTNVAHMAHLGGFMLAWILARPIARGAPSELDDSSDISIAGSTASRRQEKQPLLRWAVLIRTLGRKQEMV